MPADETPSQLPEKTAFSQPSPQGIASSPSPTTPSPEDWWEKPAVRLGAVVSASAVFLTFAVVLALTLRKPASPPEVMSADAAKPAAAGVSEARVSPSNSAPTSVSPQSTKPNPIQPPPSFQAPLPHAAASLPVPEPMPGVLPQSSSIVEAAPPPRPKPPTVPLVVNYDRFGNPIGPEVGLSRYGEFKGKKLLFWSGYENAGRVFFGPANPLWKAWESQGFTVRVEFGRFRTEWLRDIDQLWILSTARFESPIPAGVPPELVVGAVDLLPASDIPSGFTRDEYKFIVRATLDMALSRVHPFDEAAYREVEIFAKSGKGLCLLSDDEPYTAESNELARRLFGVAVKGNYIADKVAFVRDHKLTPADIRKFGGQYEVADHPLLKGVNFLYEGITISNVGVSDKLDVALKASDGLPLIAISKVPGQRVVIDCAFTQLCHGPTERTSYILKSAGAVRLAQNIAAYLAGKDLVKEGK